MAHGGIMLILALRSMAISLPLTVSFEEVVCRGIRRPCLLTRGCPTTFPNFVYTWGCHFIMHLYTAVAILRGLCVSIIGALA